MLLQALLAFKVLLEKESVLFYQFFFMCGLCFFPLVALTTLFLVKYLVYGCFFTLGMFTSIILVKIWSMLLTWNSYP